jgi:hypothetical protein
MWFLLCIGLAFYYLIQITTWTVPSFRRGVVVQRYTVSFPSTIPEELTNREIAFKNIIFRFISTGTGLFKAHPPNTLFKNRARNHFPWLLGEVQLDRKGFAQITLRIPLSKILILLAFFITLIYLFGVPNGSGLTMLFIVFSIMDFVREKENLREGFMTLKEKVSVT